MKTETDFTKFLSVAAVSTILGISKPSVLALVRSGEMPGIRVGQQVRIPERGLEGFLLGRGLDPSVIYRGAGLPATAAPSPGSPASRPADTGAITR